MAWTSPRTWVAGETVTAALLNAHVRDNEKAIGDPWTAWTPTVTSETGTFTSVSGSGQYSTFGKHVVWSATITITTVGTASGGIRFTLPVTARAANLPIGIGRENTTSGHMMLVYAFSTTVGNAAKYDNTTASASGRSIVLSGHYESA